MNQDRDIKTRRQFIRGATLSCASIAMLGLFGCGGSPQTESAALLPNVDDTDSHPAQSESSTSAASSTSPNSELVLVFSRAGENYEVGDIVTGNTMVVAQMVQARTGAELFEIEPVAPYPQGYEETKEVSQKEKEESARPEVRALPDLSGYEVIYLGFPIWWGDAPMPFYTAVESLDWHGVIVAPFNTHAGSRDGGMFQKLKTLCEGANVFEGLSITGTVAQNDRGEAQEKVDAWLASLPLD